MIITLENFTKSYGEKQLFAGVNLSMDAGDKVGIVGVNGTGKSTFLKAIAGLVPVDDGTMVTMRGLRIEYLAQDKVFDPEHTVLMEVFRGMTPLMDALRGYELALAEAAKDPESPAIQKRIMQYAEKIDELDGWQVESTAKTVLQKLGIGDYTAKAGTLSGGQQKRLALATALIQPCDLLLLDEPTNHLDSETIAWLEEYLRGQKGALLMVTHDRYFLDNTATKILELDKNRNNVVLSRRQYLEETQSEVRETFLSQLKKGQIREGVVSSIVNFGAFVDLGVHQDGLVHVSQISDKFIKHPREVLKVGDIVRVKVLNVDTAKKRIALTMKGVPQQN